MKEKPLQEIAKEAEAKQKALWAEERKRAQGVVKWPFSIVDGSLTLLGNAVNGLELSTPTGVILSLFGLVKCAVLMPLVAIGKTQASVGEFIGSTSKISSLQKEQAKAEDLVRSRCHVSNLKSAGAPQRSH